jgi:hypothetical protein
VVPRGLRELFDVAVDGQLGRATARLDEVIVRAIHDGSHVAWKELKVGQDGLSLGKGGHLEEVIGEVAQPMNAFGLTPLVARRQSSKAGECTTNSGEKGAPSGWM